MKYYLSGPMTGKEEHNFPMFKQVAENLRQKHLDILSPHELSMIPPSMAKGMTREEAWAWYLKRDMIAMFDCDAVILLPDWESSRGARLELYNADKLGLYVYELDSETLADFSPTRYGNQDDTARTVPRPGPLST